MYCNDDRDDDDDDDDDDDGDDDDDDDDDNNGGGMQRDSANLCHELTISEAIDWAPFRVQAISTRTQPE